MTQEKTPAATEVTTSAQNSAIVAEPHDGSKTGGACATEHWGVAA